ncbi:hypothetical protein J6590_030078 [Homalodisca vitripennis]|nr:hypothetical protein J6590_030078 [Homalodisca vitripennis]
MRNGKEWLGQSRCRESSRAELLSSGSPLLKRVCRRMRNGKEWLGQSRCRESSRAELLSSGSPLLKRVCRCTEQPHEVSYCQMPYLLNLCYLFLYMIP